MKNKKRKKKNKTKRINYIKYCIITIIIVLLGIGVYFFLTSPDDETSLTVLEKQWIVRNKKTLIDINVPNNLNILASDGEGVIFDYLKKVEKDTELSFNKKSYNYKTDNSSLNGLSIMVLSNSDKLNKNDVLFTSDDYVLISKTNTLVNDLDTIYNKKIGVLSDDKDMIKTSVNVNYNYLEYDDITDIVSAFTKNKINYAIVPRYYSLKDIVNNDFYINYSFDNISNKIVLRLNDNDKLSSILTKYLELFKKDKYMNSYKDEYMDFYIENTENTEVDTSTLSSKVYTYGYVKGNAYNVVNNNKLYGYAGEYVNLFSNMASMDIEYKEYKNNDELKNAIKNNKLDFAFIDFDYSNENGKCTFNLLNTNLVALSKNNYRITNKDGLNTSKLYTTSGYVNKYLNDNYNSLILSVKDLNDTTNDGILVLDENDYYYYKDKYDLSNYYVLFRDNYSNNYKFFVKNSEEIMLDFINFMLMYTDSNSIKENSINNLSLINKNTAGFNNIYLAIVLIVIIPIIVLFALLALRETRKSSKLIHKEDVLKYNDMLTSLKNRNYLRAHIDEWDEMKITPRTVIIADLNNLKYINDNYGQEEGNILIKKAAAILINTQLEKSEIIRTDGNEFLIYLIGYTKTQVSTYINKLSREFEKLPHGFGAAIGYSMIEDEIKTIDDAINEASIEMRMDKEQNYR